MITLTIGYVSGIIAAAIFVLQFVVPNALIIILVGILKNNHTAVTWSVVERNLLSSHWPLLLRADSTASRGVDRSIRLLTWLRPLALALITISAIVTPLGLYDDVLPERSQQSLRMVYVPDTGPFGFGTPPRDPQYFSRKCGDVLPLQCPGTTTDITYEIEEVDGEMYSANASWDDIDLRIPKVLAELYQSGLKDQPGSVSSFFDIQTRQYGYSQQSGAMQNKTYLVDGFQYLSTVILNDAIELFEGLIVDTKSGSIGFRNHTVPDGAGLGAEWSEDLLFIEPETECVSMNVSLEFRVPMPGSYEIGPVNITLVDDGGMSTFVQRYPKLDLSNAQHDPQLHNRAYKAGWMTNIYNMLTMNLTRPSPDAFGYVKSHVGARYPLTYSQTTAQLNGIHISSLYSALLSTTPVSNYSLVDVPTANFSNPFNIDYSNFTDVSMICSGAGGQDLTNMSNIHVECGLVFGAARRKDGTETLIFEPGKWYTQSIYSCASATKATIKTVDFRYNATRETGHTLKALSVVNVSPKAYPKKESMPLWGVETVNFTLSDMSQLWGIINPELENAKNLSTMRSPHLYLPGFSGFLSSSPGGLDNIPGTNGAKNALHAIYDVGSASSSSGINDYSGTINYAMLAKWREYSKSHQGMATVMNLIWTDIAANYLMGSRSWNTKADWLPPNLQDPKYKKRQAVSASDEDGQTRVPVQVYHRTIRYQWYFAIPALASLLLVGMVVAGAFLLMVFGRGTPSRIDHYLVHLSSGRLLGSMQYPRENKEAPTSEWITRVGRKQSDLHRLDAAYDGSISTGLSPFFAQPTGYGDKGPPPGGDYDTRSVPMRPVASSGKGYVQVSTYEQQGDEIDQREKG